METEKTLQLGTSEKRTFTTGGHFIRESLLH